MRILLVTPMWPSAAGTGDVDFGAFLVPHVSALRRLGHEVRVVAIDRRGGSRLKYAGLASRAIAAALRRRPDVIYAHMLFPAGAAGLAAARAARAPLVVMAHGQDVENLANPRLLRATRRVVAASAAVVCGSRWLAERLTGYLPECEPQLAGLGVDLAEFDPEAVAPAAWPGASPRVLCVGSLTARKNVIALADAFATLDGGSLVFVGDGELRDELEGRERVSVTGVVPHAEVARWIAAADVVCQPSLAEPFGIAALEALALARPVLVSANGGAAEFVPPQAGVVVDPLDPQALARALRAALALGAPCAAARAAAQERSAEREARRIAALLAEAVTNRR